jgi:hypothetical protein
MPLPSEFESLEKLQSAIREHLNDREALLRRIKELIDSVKESPTRWEHLKWLRAALATELKEVPALSRLCGRGLHATLMPSSIYSSLRDLEKELANGTTSKEDAKTRLIPDVANSLKDCRVAERGFAEACVMEHYALLTPEMTEDQRKASLQGYCRDAKTRFEQSFGYLGDLEKDNLRRLRQAQDSGKRTAEVVELGDQEQPGQQILNKKRKEESPDRSQTADEENSVVLRSRLPRRG